MKTLTQIIGLAGLLSVLALLAGCATAEKPNYQGHKGTSPTVYDYYPDSNKTNDHKHK